MPFPKLSIIVPYRDRAEHLRRFVPHIVTYFQHDETAKDIPVTVTIVEQAPEKPFNRGALRNVGVALNPDADYYCFHDVDFLPIRADYRFSDAPTRIIWHGAHLKPIAPGSAEMIQENYELYFGGVIVVPQSHVLRLNGYPNTYWGWGWEDAEFRARCTAERLAIKYRDGEFEALQHVNEGFAAGGNPTAANEKNRAIFVARIEQMKAGQTPHRDDGLSTLSFEIVERKRARDQNGQELSLVETVTVELPGEP